MNEKLSIFKESLRLGMIKNFENDGYLSPALFFFKEDVPTLSFIPSELFSTFEGKQELGFIITQICHTPLVQAAGIIIEAYAAETTENSEMKKLLETGNIRVSELNCKKDVILMIFSTPEQNESFIYEVDCENKKILSPLTDNYNNIGGMFNEFFNWNKN
jgi:hypothetical protein